MATEKEFQDSLTADIEANNVVLPTLPQVATEVRRVINDDGSTSTDIAGVISQDPALTARLLRIVNSPVYRGSNPINSVQVTVTRLGRKVIRNLVMTLLVKQVFHTKSTQTEKRLNKLWEHSTQVAAISRALASQFTNLDAEQAMLAGLLHDIGKLPILARADEVPEILENTHLLDEIVQKLHGQLGKTIIESWELPNELNIVASEHDHLQSNGSGPPSFLDVVIVANIQSYIGTDHEYAKLDWNTIPAFKKLGLSTNIDEIEYDTEQVAELQAALAN